MKNANGKTLLVLGKFSGMLAGFGLGAYNTLLAYKEFKAKYGEIGCQLVAMDLMGDMGNLMKSDAAFAAKISKANANGERDMGGRIKTAKGASTNTMTFCYVIQTLEELHKGKEITARFLPPFDALPEGVQKYLNNLEARVKDYAVVTASEYEAIANKAEKSEKVTA